MTNSSNTSRRQFLKRALFGAGCLGLGSLATGLPMSFFRTGLPSQEAMAAEEDERQFLILLGSQDGDPFNANAPGSYGVDGVINNPHPDMAATTLRLGAVTTTAAAPWATLPQWVLERSNFIHHRTYQNAHPQFGKVLGLVGSAKSESGTGTEQIASVYSSENAQALQTIQVEPVALTNSLTFQGRVLQSILPQTLSTMFRSETGKGLELEKIRQSTLDSLHAVLKDNGTPEQRRWVDRYATSHTQVQQLDERFLERFGSIDNDGPIGQVDAALTLIMMRVSPVIHINIPFGGDNHADQNLAIEHAETITALETMNHLFKEIDSLGLRDKVTVANLNVFGRTLAKKGTEGRDHNLNHHVMMICGPKVRPGVVGSIVPTGNDFGATAIDSATGKGIDSGDIPADETLEAAAKTLGTAIGMPADRLDLRISGGKVIKSVIQS